MIWNFCQKAKVKGPTKHNKSQFNLRRTAISFLLIDQMLEFLCIRMVTDYFLF